MTEFLYLASLFVIAFPVSAVVYMLRVRINNGCWRPMPEDLAAFAPTYLLGATVGGAGTIGAGADVVTTASAFLAVALPLALGAHLALRGGKAMPKAYPPQG